MPSLFDYAAPPAVTDAPAVSSAESPPAPARPSTRTLVQEDTAEGTYVRTDLTAAYHNTPWPMLPPESAPGAVEGFYRSFVQDRLADVFVVYDRLLVRPPVAPYRFRPDPQHRPWPAAPFVPGYFAPLAPGAHGLEVRLLTPTRPAEDTRPTASALTLDLDPVETLNGPLDAPFLSVLRYTDPMAPELRTNLVRSRSGDAMMGARLYTGRMPRYFFFNAAPGAEPDPVVTTELPAEPGASWVLFGLKPGASYAVSLEDGALIVTERAGALHTASRAGVLQVGAAPQAQNVPAFTYALPEAGPVRVALCTPEGEEVAVLTEGVHTPGMHAVPLVGVAPGEYLMQVMAQGTVRTQRITVPG